MSIRETIGANLRTYRKYRGISQEKLAELCGCSRQYVSKIEQAQSNIGINKVEWVCQALGIELVQLLAEFDDRGYLVVGKTDETPSEVEAEASDQDGEPIPQVSADFISDRLPKGTGASVVFQKENGMLQSIDIPVANSDLTLQTLINLQKKGYRGDYLTVRLRKMLPELMEVYQKYA